MSNIYENIIEEFNKRQCKLLTTKEQHNEIIKSSKKQNYKLNYIASCGHIHNVFYNVFKSRNTGIVCPSCKTKTIGEYKKEKIKNNEMSKTHNIEQEYTFITNICKYLNNSFEIIKAFDGCLADIIFKPNNITNDNWVGIQVKTTGNRHLTYSFHVNNNYKNCLILLYCCEDECMWLIPENVLENRTKLSIGYNKSKYNTYKVCKDDIINKLNELYNNTSKFSFDKLNTPINIYQQREQIFRKYREEKIDFIKYEYGGMEGTVYDFKIGNFKIQEKVTKKCDKTNRYRFDICKNNGHINGKKNQIQYDIGDNDFYWLNCDDKKTFFVIPEDILVKRCIIGNNNKQTFWLSVRVNDILHKKSSWLQPYMFDYENIDKNRLLDILQHPIPVSTYTAIVSH
jgi:hypothetical protein